MNAQRPIETRFEGSVQDCGCIAIPEALQTAFHLGPGARFRIEAAGNGSHLLLIPLESSAASTDPRLGAACTL
jgi:hypothetical protein